MDAKVATEEFMVPAADPGISLYLRNKHPEGVNRFAAGKILLYVHGATYPAETAFDLSAATTSTWSTYAATADPRDRRRWTSPHWTTRRSCTPRLR